MGPVRANSSTSIQNVSGLRQGPAGPSAAGCCWGRL